MPYYESSRVTLPAAEAIARASLVTLSRDGLKPCGAADIPVGFTELGAAAAGDAVSVRLVNAPGTFECRAADSITAGALVKPAEGGAVSAHTEGALAAGIALSAAESGGLLQMVPIFDRSPAGA